MLNLMRSKFVPDRLLSKETLLYKLGKDSSNHRLSFFACIFVCIFLVSASFLYPKWNVGETEATISWDVMGYYLYLPSFFYDNIFKLNNLQHIIATYHPVDGSPNAFLLPNGNYMMKYSVGMALMYSPFFGVAHIWAQIRNYPQDGFSYPYQVMISFGSLFVSLIGLWFARKNLLRYFNDKVTAVTLVVLVLATNYFNYISYVGPMTHNYLFTIYSIVIWLTSKWYEKPSGLKCSLIGILCGMAVVIRPTEIIILLIPFFWGVQMWREIRNRVFLLWNHFTMLLIATVAFMIPVFIQLLYWKTASGQWLYYSYQDQGFSWNHPHFYYGIFTYKNGWLVYTPVMILALIGFIFLFKNRRDLFWPTFLFTLVNVYIVYSWDIWWYGGSFGSRAMIQSYSILIFPMAAFFNWVGRKKILNSVTVVAVLFCIWLNLLQTYQCHARGIFEAENMTRAYYWRIFGKTRIDPMDKKFLDSKEEMPVADAEALSSISEVKSPAFATMLNSQTYGRDNLAYLSDSIQFTKEFVFPVNCEKGSWFRISAMVFFPEKEWATSNMSRLIAKLYSGSKEVRSNMIRIQRITDENKWQKVFVDIKCSESLDADTLKVSFWNSNGNKKIFIDDLLIEKSGSM